MKIQKMLYSITVLALCLLPAGCASSALPEGMSEDQVRTVSEQIVSLLDSDDYSSVEALYDDTMKTALPQGQLKTALSSELDRLGSFQSFDQESFYGKQGYAVAVLTCSYDSGKAVFTISLDPDYSLAGLYMK
jgi:hypothetical protein